MMNKITSRQNGFTLIETLIAMAIFTIGILGIFGFQTSAIKENLVANSITTGTLWAADKVESLLGLSYTHDLLAVTGSCASLPDSVSAAQSLPPDNQEGIIDNDHIGYTVYWAVARDCMLKNILDASSEEQEQKPKTLRIIVTKDSGAGPKELAVLTYMKQNGQVK